MTAPGEARASQEPPTRHAQKACAEWLVACLHIGWRKSDLDFLESLWWRYHNHRGELITPQDAKA